MAITQIKGSNIEDGTVVAADIKDDSITNAKIKSDAAIAASKLASTLDLSGKTVTLPAAAVTAHAVTPTLDAPVITGTLSVLDSGTVTHTIANYSADCSYTITPTNCTAGAVNASGEFVITHTSGTPSYTIKATTASLGLDDSALTTKNITMQLSAPTLSNPAGVGTATDVVYTITSTATGDDKLILDPGTANFTYQSESGPGTASKVGNTVECIGFGTGNPVVTIQFTATGTYSVTAKAVNIAGTYGTSANSAADSITIANTYNAHFLVLAGGGTAGGTITGGGGAGGLRTSWAGGSGGGASSQAQTAFTPGVVYTCTVGGGGSGGTTTRYNGESSNITGSGYTTITCVGGGYGIAGGTAPNGGCGGSGHIGGSGTAGEGFDGASDTNWTMGGGGGTASVGLVDGPGGGGKQVNIDTNNYYWGGGGGGAGHGSTAGNGGIGGGGGGSTYAGYTAGTGGGSAINPGGNGAAAANAIGGNGGANSGGGGGGCADSGANASSGGSGIIIIRAPAASITGGASPTVTGSPTVATVGADTVITFTGTGTFVA
jgi:hypothetical protein